MLVCRLRLGGQHANLQETVQGFPSARCARPMTELSPAWPNCSARKRRHRFEIFRREVHFFTHFSWWTQDRSGEGDGSSPRVFLARRPSGPSEAERLDAAPALRTIVTEEWAYLSSKTGFMGRACCDSSRRLRHQHALATVYVCRQRLLQLAHSSTVDKRKRKFTNVYPFRGGVSKILPVRSAESARRRTRSSMGHPAKPIQSISALCS